jgi:hypothetical protein
MKCISFGLILAVSPFYPLLATAETAQLLSDTFHETLRPTANTGGARVMGFQIVGADPLTDLQAFVPVGWAGKPFCVRTGTSDGLYDSENTYIAPDDTSTSDEVPPPVTRVEVPHVTRSDHVEALGALDPQGFGIRIQEGACETTTSDSIGALAVWRAEGDTDRFAVFVNSFDADRLVALPAGGDVVECDVISADISVAYDRICTIPFETGQGKMIVRLVPFKNGLRGLPEFLTIALP